MASSLRLFGPKKYLGSSLGEHLAKTGGTQDATLNAKAPFVLSQVFEVLNAKLPDVMSGPAQGGLMGSIVSAQSGSPHLAVDRGTFAVANPKAELGPDAPGPKALPGAPDAGRTLILESTTGGAELSGGDGALGFAAPGTGEVNLPSGGSPAGRAPLELLIQFDPRADVAQIKSAAAALGGGVVETIHTSVMAEAGRGLVVRMTFGQSLTLEKALEIAGKLPGVTLAEPNWGIGVQVTSNDTYFTGGSMWGLYSEQSATKNVYGSQASDAWAAGHTTASKTVVGVIDSGIDYTHPDLYLSIWINQLEIASSLRSVIDYDADGQVTFRDLNQKDSTGAFLSVKGGYVSDANGNSRIDAYDLLTKSVLADGKDTDSNGRIDDLVGWDFVNNDNNPFDDHSHGTHVAGTIGAIGGNGTGVVGVAWDVQLMALKTLSASGSGSSSAAIQAVDYYTAATKAASLAGIDQKFAATNNSWGGGGYSSLLLQSITEGAKQNNLFIAAAGNGGSDSVGDDNDLSAYYPACYDTTSGAGYDAVIAVASLTSSGSLSSFSNWGKTSVELAAPGSSIMSTLPGGTDPSVANSGKYGSYNGTSMATPHVAGAIALYAALNPTATAAQIRDAILTCTVATTSLEGKTMSGGRLDVGSLVALGSKSGTLEGTVGDDLLVGTERDDTINGHAGNDTLIGAHGNDVLAGGDGNDTLVLDAGDDTLDGGLGHDWVRVDGTGIARIDLAVTTVQDTGYGWDTLVNVENASGNVGNDTLSGTDAANTLIGGDGQDTLTGRAGHDQVRGEDGNDTLLLDAGDDTHDGGLGLDWVRVDGTAAARIDLAVTTAQDTGYGWDTLLNFENASGNAGNDRLSGTEAANTLIGGNGQDTLMSRGGHDQVWGEGGNDILVLDAGDDTLDGGADADWLRLTGSTAATIDLAMTTAQVTGYGSDTIRGIENVSGGSGADKIYGEGGGNALHGNAGNDLLYGRAGGDTLVGGSGTDTLYGGASDGARDIFVFNSTAESVVGTKRDLIRDFLSSTDLIDLRGIDANSTSIAAGDQAFLFSGTTAQAHSVWYAKSSSDLILRGDVNGDKTADFEVRLVSVSGLSAGDFLL